MASFLLKGVLLFNYTDGTLLCVTVRSHRIQKLCYTVLSGLPVVVGCHPVVY